MKTQLKYKILKAIDVSGLTFLRPVVLLCYGEEPKVQLRLIGRYIAVPLVVFGLFLLAWAYLAPKHKTKSGEVPTPSVVWDSAKGIWRFHQREGAKERAFMLDDETRDQQLADANARLKELVPLEEKAARRIAEAEALHKETVETAVAPVRAEYVSKKDSFKAAVKQRTLELKQEAGSIKSGDADAYDAYLQSFRAHLAQSEREDEILKKLKAEEDDIRNRKFPELIAARKQQTEVAEEKQFLAKMVENLYEDNRTLKIEAMQAGLDADRAALQTATGDQAYLLAKRILRTEEMIGKISESTYAKPMTLPDQILRSLACAFFGFFLGAFIAIPIGVLCGLSKTFMAALTPFIALFKPVSPIVWLPIALIIVGGFIDNPDDHWLMEFLASLPLIGWMKINPAFIASGITVALCSLWPTLVNTALGVASIDKDHINVARTLRLGFWSRLFKIVIPSALPLIFAGLRISLGVGWMVLIAAELLSSSEGIGKYVWDMFNNGSSQTFAQMFVVVFIVGAIGLTLDRIMIVFQRLVSFDGAPTVV